MYIADIFSPVYLCCLVKTQSKQKWITDTSEDHSHENKATSSYHCCDVHRQQKVILTHPVLKDYISISPSNSIRIQPCSSVKAHKYCQSPIQRHCLFTEIYGGVSGMAENRNTVSHGISVHKLSWSLNEGGAISGRGRGRKGVWLYSSSSVIRIIWGE
jgi:hypothetical protein